MNRFYREGTTLDEIVGDGWARGFSADQTVDEAKAQGFQVSAAQVVSAWVKLDTVEEDICKKLRYYE